GNHRKSQNHLTRVYESNGPDVKIRGTASHIAEKYITLARDAQGCGDPGGGAGVGRPGGRRELLSARRALLPPDRRGAGTVSSAEPVLQSAAAASAGRRARRPATGRRCLLRWGRGRQSAVHGSERAKLRTARAAAAALFAARCSTVS